MDIEMWKKTVQENTRDINSLVKDRIELKEIFETYLKEFFNFDEIDFSQNCDRISLKWRHNSTPNINKKSIDRLDMDWAITTGFSDNLGMGIIVEIFPWGG